jgi:flagellar capping protein FliD
LGHKLNDIITKAASTSSIAEKRGTLVRIAGTELNTGDNTSTLGNKMEEIDNYISNLKLRLESEYNRYWKQFSALEVAVSKMNSQSSWLQSNAG